MLKEQARLKATVGEFDAQQRAIDDAAVLLDLAHEEKDEATAVEAATTIGKAEEAVGKMEFARMLSGPYDRERHRSYERSSTCRRARSYARRTSR